MGQEAGGKEVDGRGVEIVSEEREEAELPAGRWTATRRTWRSRRRRLVFIVLSVLILPYALIGLYLLEFIHPVSTLMLRDLVLLRGYDRQWVEFDDIAPVLVQSVMM
ncbi:monofunctional biosynthetic peptidoglycan transglycosylase, partial [Sinorhizobium meliloti]